MQKLLIYIFLLIFASSCTINRYIMVVNEPMPLYDAIGANGERYSNILPKDTIEIYDKKLKNETTVFYKASQKWTSGIWYKTTMQSKKRTSKRAYRKRLASSKLSTRYTFRPYDPKIDYINTTRSSTPSTGATIHTGPRGGKFYYNSKGNKTYIKK